MNKYLLIFISGAFFSFAEVVFKYWGLSDGMDYSEMFPYVWMFGGLFSFFYYMLGNKFTTNISNKNLRLIFLFTFFTLVGNYLYWTGTKKTYNPGLGRALFTASSVFIITIISAYGYKKYINIYQILGIFLVILGISLILIKQHK